MKIVKITFICMLILLSVYANANAGENKVHKEKQIFCSMAGSGNPWGA